MMGLSPSDVGALTWWQYGAMIDVWTERHADPADEKVDPPSEDFVRHRQQLLYERGIAGASVH